mgnify:CR=1 FL=1
MTEKIETPQEEMPELMPDPINFTDAAVAKVKELMDEEGNPSLKLRVFVQGGGSTQAAAPASSTALRSTRSRTPTTP